MIFYKASIKSIDDNLNKAIPSVNGENVIDGKNLFALIGQNIILNDPVPVFDYFHLENYAEEEEEWEWIKNDAHGFLGVGSIIQGWFVSDKLRNLLEHFSICGPFKFYPAKLLYKGVKYDYFIFHTAYEVLDELVFDRSKFVIRKGILNPQIVGVYNQVIQDKNIFRQKREEIFSVQKAKLFPSEILLRTRHDLIFLKGFENQILISETLKNEMERLEITGLNFNQSNITVKFL